MTNYALAVDYRIKENRKLLYEWEVSRDQWHYCMDYLIKIGKKAARLTIIFSIIIVWFLGLLFYLYGIYDEFEKIMPGTLIVAALVNILVYFSVRSSCNRLKNPENYKFFIDDQGIYNGSFYAYLEDTKVTAKYIKDNFSKIIMKKEYRYLRKSSCEIYRLYEKENKFEIFIHHIDFTSNYNPTKKEWFCFIFNDKDKEPLYQIIKGWQNAGKIKPCEISDERILNNYLTMWN